MPRGAPLRWRIFGVCLGLALGWAACAGAQNELGLAVKSAYLYKFAPFVAWPPEVFSSATSDFYLCVVGNDPFGPLLDSAVAGQKIADHPIVVRRLTTARSTDECHIMYVGGSREQSVASAVSETRGRPILTVTDNSKAPGLVDFVIEQGRVRFRIDMAAAIASGLSIDSRLLSVALSVQVRKMGSIP